MCRACLPLLEVCCEKSVILLSGMFFACKTFLPWKGSEGGNEISEWTVMVKAFPYFKCWKD